MPPPLKIRRRPGRSRERRQQRFRRGSGLSDLADTSHPRPLAPPSLLPAPWARPPRALGSSTGCDSCELGTYWVLATHLLTQKLLASRSAPLTRLQKAVQERLCLRQRRTHSGRPALRPGASGCARAVPPAAGLPGVTAVSPSSLPARELPPDAESTLRWGFREGRLHRRHRAWPGRSDGKRAGDRGSASGAEGARTQLSTRSRCPVC